MPAGDLRSEFGVEIERAHPQFLSRHRLRKVFHRAASAVTSVNAAGTYNWTSAGLISDVQNWVNAPAGNFGWFLKGDESQNNTSKRFDTRENATASFRPVLTIDYTPAPAPGGLGVLVMAALAARKRRRTA